MKPHSLSGTARKDCVERREVPDRCNVLWRRLDVCRLEVRILQEVATHLRCKEHDEGENHQEDDNCDQVFAGVVRVEGDPIERHPVGAFFLFDLNAIRIVRTDFMQRYDVHKHETDQRQRQCDDVQRKESIQRDIRN